MKARQAREEDERAMERRRKLAREENENFADIQAELTILRTAPDALSVRGKRIERRTRPREEEREETRGFLAAIFGGTGGISLSRMRAAFDASPLSHIFERKTVQVPVPDTHFHEDRDHIYDTEKVCTATFNILTGESVIIAEKVRALSHIRDGAEREREMQAVVRLAEQFNMRRHPVTGRYIHDIERVEEMEQTHNPRGHLSTLQIICVFRVKALAGDMRGMNRKVGDVYNTDPQEEIASGDHLKGHNVPAPRP